MHISVNGAALYFDVAGTKTRFSSEGPFEVPTCLVLHGGPGSDHLAVMPTIDRLAEIAQVIWIDHRGNGRSGGDDPALWHLNQWADDIRAFCDTLRISKPIIIGQSFGGIVALKVAANFPELPNGIVVSSIGARWLLDPVLEMFEHLGGVPARDAAAKMWTRMSDEDFDNYKSICVPLYSATAAAGAFRRNVKLRPDVAKHFLKPNGEFQTMDLRPELANIRCPVLVLGGDRDPVQPVAGLRELASNLVNARVTLKILQNCGHGVWRDEPEAAIEILNSFIHAASATEQVTDPEVLAQEASYPAITSDGRGAP